MKKYHVTYRVTLHIEAESSAEAARMVRNLIIGDNQNLLCPPTLVTIDAPDDPSQPAAAPAL